jgi:catechol 2,3-dioxygenase-like lactoylglutathione lyase family enzyme
VFDRRTQHFGTSQPRAEFWSLRDWTVWAPGATIRCMEITRIEHVQLAMPASGEDLARAFYREALGIPEMPKPPHLAKRGGCWFERGELKIHLGVEADFRPARKAHPALLVTGLRALSEKLRSCGYALKEDEPLEGYHRIYVDDPFGNRIELMEPDS